MLGVRIGKVCKSPTIQGRDSMARRFCDTCHRFTNSATPNVDILTSYDRLPFSCMSGNQMFRDLRAIESRLSTASESY